MKGEKGKYTRAVVCDTRRQLQRLVFALFLDLKTIYKCIPSWSVKLLLRTVFLKRSLKQADENESVGGLPVPIFETKCDRRYYLKYQVWI